MKTNKTWLQHWSQLTRVFFFIVPFENGRVLHLFSDHSNVLFHSSLFFLFFADAAFEFRASYKTLSNVFESLHLTWQLTVRWGDARTGLVAHCKSRHTPWCFSQPALCTGRLWFHSFMRSCFIGMQPMFMIKDRSVRSEWHRCATYPASLIPTLISIHWSRVGKVNSLTHLS